ncbi:MAG: glycoside hydrolase family 44 protein, partial [Gammaproteobacteria bacterium]
MIKRIGLIVTLSVSLTPIGIKAASADMSVYDDALGSGWDNWSWNSTLNFSNTAPVHDGARSLSVRYDSAWAGLYLHTYSGYDTGLYDRLSFWIHGGSSGDQRLVIVANGDSANTYQVTAKANTWTQIVFPLSALGNPAFLTDLYWQDLTGGSQPVFYLDDIVLLAGSVTPTPLTLNIDVGADRHTISEDIYGMNFADEALAAELKLPVRRWGGNATTRYNWQTSMRNTASDWYFENLPDGAVNSANLPDGSASDQFVEQDRRTGTRTLLTVPLIGWTVKSTSPRNHPYDCGFKVSKYGSQQSVDQWDTDCGNGVRSSGGDITGNDPRDTSDPVDAGFVGDWINHLTGKYGTAAAGGVAYYNLDNEPMLWNSTHRDVHPEAVTYDEMLDRTLDYAAAIKAADPSAKTLGPVVWGWCAYFYSALDGCGIGADYQAHGNLPFAPWYLNQLKAFEQQQGLRLLDYFDLHYYPQAGGVALSPAGSAATQALRLRSTRSLWDANYTDESWISDTEPGGVKVRLIGRMRDWVNSYYPGTKLAITEYNWGALESINGALAQADVLGIFGREGLDLATLWSPPAPNQPGAHAFRMFLNYDGAGHRFGNVSVRAASSNHSDLSIYAAQRTSDNALTVLVINKTAAELASPVEITGLSLPSSTAVYRYSAANPSAIVQLADQGLSGSGFSAVFPANSITLFVMTPGGPNDVILTGSPMRP